MRIIPVVLACLAVANPVSAQDQIYFSAVDDVRARLVERINAENVRIDMAVSLLTDRTISQALVNRFNAGVAVRLIGDRYSIFDIKDPARRTEFYWLASQGVPIRVRQNPTSYPELAHWKATIFAGQNVVSFGTANYTSLELRPQSGAYSDQSVVFTSDPALVNAFKSEFDRMWADQDRELPSIVGRPPYFANWNDMCPVEPACADYATLYPTPQPMVISTARLEPAAPTPANLLWAQGSAFNTRLVSEINAESAFIDVVVHRLTVDSVTNALLAKHQAGVPVRVIMEPTEYRNTEFPEFWLTAANLDRLHAAGVPIKQRAHAGLTHMKMLITSAIATHASSNFSAAWQRDHNYFVSATEKPDLYNAMRDRFAAMWNDAAGFVPFTPLKPHAATLQEPANGANGVPTNVALVWARAPFASSYDVYLGTSAASLQKVGTVDARLVSDPPRSYWWRPTLQPHTTYYWRVVATTRTGLTEASTTRSFTTGEITLDASPAVVELSAAGGAGEITITASSGTAWTAVSDSAWLTVTPSAGSGNARIAYNVSYNDTPTSRVARISVNGVWIAVSQDADALPSGPRLLTASTSLNKVDFAWQAGAGGGRALRYQIEVASSDSFTSALFFMTDVGAARSLRISTLPPGSYFARVSAVNAMGASAPSEIVQFSVRAASGGGGGGGRGGGGGGTGGTGGGGDTGGNTPAPCVTPNAPGPASPFAPRDLDASVIGSRVAISWAAPRQGTVIAYHVEAGLTPGATDYVLPTGARSIAVTNVPVGVYFVRVRTISPSGPTDASAEIAVRVGTGVAAATPCAPPPAVPAPMNLVAQVSGQNVTLQWAAGAQADGGATQYILEAGFAPGLANAAVLPVGAQTVIGVSAVPRGVYYVRVRAANGTLMSAASNEVMVVVR